MLDDPTWLDGVWRARLAVDPALTVSEWADRHRVLSSLSAEPGKWSTARTPFGIRKTWLRRH
jgi:phage terminase large subunit GpA-like protein